MKLPMPKFLIAPGGTAELRANGVELRDRATGAPLPEVTRSAMVQPGHVLFGMRSGAEGREIPGTRHGYECGRCAAEVRLAPSGQAMVAEGVPVWCIECLPFHVGGKA